MSEVVAQPPMTLMLSEQERVALLEFLEQKLSATLVEEHRTHAFAYREHLQQKEAVLQGLIDKLRRE